MKNKVINELLNKHFATNIKLGLFYTKLYSIISNTAMTNFASYIKDLAEDKLGIHKDKIVNFMIDAGYNLNTNVATEIKEVTEKTTLKEIANIVYKFEEEVINEINHFAKTALAENEFQAFEFIQWFVKDGLKDFGEISYICELFKESNDLLVIDQKICSMLSK